MNLFGDSLFWRIWDAAWPAQFFLAVIGGYLVGLWIVR